jgi:hypothetical protein
VLAAVLGLRAILAIDSLLLQPLLRFVLPDIVLLLLAGTSILKPVLTLMVSIFIHA